MFSKHKRTQISCAWLLWSALAFFFVANGELIKAQGINESGFEDFPTYSSPYKLSNRFVIGVSFNALVETDKGDSQFFEGYGAGLTAEYFLVSFYSLGLRYDRFQFNKAGLSNSGLTIHSTLLNNKFVAAPSSKFSPYFSLGLGSSRGNDVSTETIQLGIGIQSRPSQKTWARVEATAVGIGFGAKPGNISIDGINGDISAEFSGVRLAFGLVL